MSSEIFHFKQFSVRQDRCAMKIGTDGVLLGAWCNADIHDKDVFHAATCPRILDIGAGTGLISLMLAQRNPNALIDAVEIDPDAASQCHDNFASSPWSDRLTVHAVSLSEFNSDINTVPHSAAFLHYNLIVSNPPFYNATLKPDDHARAVARHKDSLPVNEIMQFAASHLTPDGTLALIYPTSYDEEVMTSAVLNDLRPSRLCDVITSVRKPPKRRLAEFSLFSNPSSPHHESPLRGSLLRETLLIGSPEYKMLTRDYYL